MATIELPIQPPTVPEGFCNSLGPDWIQQIVNLMGQAVAIQNSASGSAPILLNQETEPDPEQRNAGFLWRKPSTGLIYEWGTGGVGAWVVVHPEPPAGYARRLFVGDLTQLQSYDGGAPGTVGDASGPMWEEDTAFIGRVPMGPGLIPGSDPAVTLTVATNAGAGSVTLLQENLPEISLTLPYFVGNDSTGEDHPTVPNNTDQQNASAQILPDPLGDGTPISTTGPVRGAYVIKRTNRIYIKGN